MNNQSGINLKIDAYMRANPAAVKGKTRQQIISIMLQNGQLTAAEVSQLSGMLSGGMPDTPASGWTLERSTPSEDGQLTTQFDALNDYTTPTTPINTTPEISTTEEVVSTNETSVVFGSTVTPAHPLDTPTGDTVSITPQDQLSPIETPDPFADAEIELSNDNPFTQPTTASNIFTNPEELDTEALELPDGMQIDTPPVVLVASSPTQPQTQTQPQASQQHPTHRAKIMAYVQANPNCMRLGQGAQDVIRLMQAQGKLTPEEAQAALKELEAVQRAEAAVGLTPSSARLATLPANKGHNMSTDPKPTGAGKKLAQSLIDYAADNYAAASDMPFQGLRSDLLKLSTADLVDFMQSFDSEESLMELVFDEIGSSGDAKKWVCEQVFKTLQERAELLGIDLGDVPEQFRARLEADCRHLYVATDTLDRLTGFVVSRLEATLDLNETDCGIISRKKPERGNLESNRALQRRLDETYANFGERVDSQGNRYRETPDGKPYEGQLQRDGWTGDLADGFKSVWGMEHTADNVRKDLQVAAKEMDRLEAARLESPEKYAEVFADIFKVPYNYSHIYAYQKAESAYIRAGQAMKREQQFNKTCEHLLKDIPLMEEFIHTGTRQMHKYTTSTKEEVFQREYANLAEMLPNGEAFLQAAFRERGIENGTLEQKYAVMQEIARAISKQLHQETTDACGGESYEEVSARYDRAYKAAYGTTNDVMKRVNDYVVSQQIGSAIVKGAVVIGSTIAVAMSGGSLAGVAAASSGSTFIVNLTDTATRGDVLKTLRDKDVCAASIEIYEKMDWAQVIKDSAIAGASVFVGGGVTKGVSVFLKNARPAAQALAEVTGDAVTDGGIQWVTEGTVTIDGVVLSVVLSGTGNMVQHRVTHIDGVPVKGADAQLLNGSVVSEDTLRAANPSVEPRVQSEASPETRPAARAEDELSSRAEAADEPAVGEEIVIFPDRPVDDGHLPVDDEEIRWLPDRPSRGVRPVADEEIVILPNSPAYRSLPVEINPEVRASQIESLANGQDIICRASLEKLPEHEMALLLAEPLKSRIVSRQLLTQSDSADDIALLANLSDEGYVRYLKTLETQGAECKKAYMEMLKACSRKNYNTGEITVNESMLEDLAGFVIPTLKASNVIVDGQLDTEEIREILHQIYGWGVSPERIAKVAQLANGQPVKCFEKLLTMSDDALEFIASPQYMYNANIVKRGLLKDCDSPLEILKLASLTDEGYQRYLQTIKTYGPEAKNAYLEIWDSCVSGTPANIQVNEQSLNALATLIIPTLKAQNCVSNGQLDITSMRGLLKKVQNRNITPDRIKQIAAYAEGQPVKCLEDLLTLNDGAINRFFEIEVNYHDNIVKRGLLGENDSMLGVLKLACLSDEGYAQYQNIIRTYGPECKSAYLEMWDKFASGTAENVQVNEEVLTALSNLVMPVLKASNAVVDGQLDISSMRELLGKIESGEITLDRIKQVAEFANGQPIKSLETLLTLPDDVVGHFIAADSPFALNIQKRGLLAEYDDAFDAIKLASLSDEAYAKYLKIVSQYGADGKAAYLKMWEQCISNDGGIKVDEALLGKWADTVIPKLVRFYDGVNNGADLFNSPSFAKLFGALSSPQAFTAITKLLDNASDANDIKNILYLCEMKAIGSAADKAVVEAVLQKAADTESPNVVDCLWDYYRTHGSDNKGDSIILLSIDEIDSSLKWGKIDSREIEHRVLSSLLNKLHTRDDFAALGSMLPFCDAGEKGWTYFVNATERLSNMGFSIKNMSDIYSNLCYSGKSPASFFAVVDKLTEKIKLFGIDIAGKDNKKFVELFDRCLTTNDEWETFGKLLDKVHSPEDLDKLIAMRDHWYKKADKKAIYDRFLEGASKLNNLSIDDMSALYAQLSQFGVTSFNQKMFDVWMSKMTAIDAEITDINGQLVALRNAGEADNSPKVLSLEKKLRAKKRAINEHFDQLVVCGFPQDSPVVAYCSATGKLLRVKDIDRMHEIPINSEYEQRAFNLLVDTAQRLEQDPNAFDVARYTAFEISQILPHVKSDADLAALARILERQKPRSVQEPIFGAIFEGTLNVTQIVQAMKNGGEIPSISKAHQKGRVAAERLLGSLNIPPALKEKYINTLASLRATNPAMYKKLRAAGFLRLLEEGKIPEELLLVNRNGVISPRAIEELDKIYRNIPLVTTLSSVDELRNLSQRVPNGEVCELGGKLYINVDGNAVPIKMSKSTYERLFPRWESSSINQGNLGDCYLVSTLEALLDNPKSKAAILQFFEETADGVALRLPGLDEPIFFKDGIPLDVKGKGIQGNSQGLQMLEQACAWYRVKDAERYVGYGDMSRLTDVEALMQGLEGGHQHVVVSKLLGIDMDVMWISFEGATLNDCNRMKQCIIDNANNPNIMMAMGVRHDMESINLPGQHAYAIKGYEPETGMVHVSNPHDTSVVLRIHIDELVPRLADIEYIDFSSPKVTQGLALTDVDGQALRSAPSQTPNATPVRSSEQVVLRAAPEQADGRLSQIEELANGAPIQQPSKWLEADAETVAVLTSDSFRNIVRTHNLEELVSKCTPEQLLVIARMSEIGIKPEAFSKLMADLKAGGIENINPDCLQAIETLNAKLKQLKIADSVAGSPSLSNDIAQFLKVLNSSDGSVVMRRLIDTATKKADLLYAFRGATIISELPLDKQRFVYQVGNKVLDMGFMPHTTALLMTTMKKFDLNPEFQAEYLKTLENISTCLKNSGAKLDYRPLLLSGQGLFEILGRINTVDDLKIVNKLFARVGNSSRNIENIVLMYHGFKNLPKEQSDYVYNVLTQLADSPSTLDITARIVRNLQKVDFSKFDRELFDVSLAKILEADRYGREYNALVSESIRMRKENPNSEEFRALSARKKEMYELWGKKLDEFPYTSLEFAASLTKESPLYDFFRQTSLVPKDAANMHGIKFEPNGPNQPAEPNYQQLAFNELLAYGAKVEMGTRNANGPVFTAFELSEMLPHIKSAEDVEILKQMLDKYWWLTPSEIVHGLKNNGELPPPPAHKDDFNRSLAAVKRLMGDNCDPSFIPFLTDMRTNNPHDYMELMNSGFMRLLRDGKIPGRYAANQKGVVFSKRTMEEIGKIRDGVPAVRTVDADVDIARVPELVGNGEVVSHAGKLYINVDGKLTNINLTKEKFEELFPVLTGTVFHQGGNLGDCWLVSSLEAFLGTPKGKAALCSLFTQVGDDIYIKFPDSNTSYLFPNGRPINNESAAGKGIQGDCSGVQILEQAFAAYRMEKAGRALPNSDMAQVASLRDTMDFLKAGTHQEFVSAVFDRQLTTALDNNVVSSPSVEECTRMKACIIENVNNPDCVMFTGTIRNVYNGLQGGHAYSIKSYNPETGMVEVVDPHETAVVRRIHIDKLVSSISNVSFIVL